MSEFILQRISNLCNDLKSQMIEKIGGVRDIEYVKSGYKTDNKMPVSGWQPFVNGSKVSGKDGHFWFRAHFNTPEAAENTELQLCVRTGREGNVDAVNPQSIVYLNGKMVQGMDINHTETPIDAGTEYDMLVYLYVGMINQEIDINFSVERIRLSIEKLYYDLRVPLDACGSLERSSENYALISGTLEQAVNMLSFRRLYDKEYMDGIKKATDFLQREFYDGLCKKTSAVVHCVGHTHIDVAWMWTYAQTREKVQRSFSTVLSLMKKYPEYIFMSSQPQLYQYLKEEAPEVYAQVKQRIAEGRWEAEGGMWLEADCNLISGESMVRQLLHGKRFMKDEFGKESKILWLPDVFGYSAALPQLLKKSGINDFVTSKISWNETNTIPYDTFEWQGIDGSSVLAHFITAQWLPKNNNFQRVTTYVGKLHPSMVAGAWNRYQQKEFNKHTVITFGFGDGGGGPTKEMLEYQRRMQYGLPGIPATEMSTATEWVDLSRREFYDNAAKLKRMPRWVGELYLELHRGTYTSIAKNKLNNRKCELLMQKTEQLCRIAELLLGEKYPREKLNRLWKAILLNQFHDVLPGSSIGEVYEDTDRIYAETARDGVETANLLTEKLAEETSADSGYLIYNALGFKTAGTVKVDGVTRETGLVPTAGWCVCNFADNESSVFINGRKIENRYFKVTLDESGRIESLLDKRCSRQVFKNGEFGNEFQVFEDFPRNFDAWEISDYYKQKQWILDGKADFETVDDGDRRGIKISRNYQSSVINQIIYLYNTTERIDFETEIDWHEEHQLLKVAFPFNVLTDKATYEIQYGYVERPTHSNTSWDAAKFEVCAHRWADVSEYGYGVTLMNDCKYGHSCEGSVLKLSLLKCATYPNPNADKGHHSFTYSLFPHEGDFRNAGSVKQAHLLNQPLQCVSVKPNGGKLPSKFSFVSVQSDNVIVDTVKKSENGGNTVIRLYEISGGSALCNVKFGCKAKNVYVCDLSENILNELQITENSVTVPFGCFEVITLMVIN